METVLVSLIVALLIIVLLVVAVDYAPIGNAQIKRLLQFAIVILGVLCAALHLP